MIAWLPVALLLASSALAEGVPCTKFVACQHSTGEAITDYADMGVTTVGVVEVQKDLVGRVIALKGDKCTHLYFKNGDSITVIGSAAEVKQRLGWAECD